MKSTFAPPRITLQGCLRSVTAAASEVVDFSDARLKRDVEPYEPVLSRLNKLSSTDSDHQSGRRPFQKPSVRREGSLKDVTAIISGPQGSDASLKTDIEPHDRVLPRLRELS